MVQWENAAFARLKWRFDSAWLHKVYSPAAGVIKIARRASLPLIINN